MFLCLFVKICNDSYKRFKDFKKNTDIRNTTEWKGHYMLKKLDSPTCNTFNGVEYILRGAKKRRASAMANARRMNAEAGVQTKLVAVK